MLTIGAKRIRYTVSSVFIINLFSIPCFVCLNKLCVRLLLNNALCTKRNLERTFIFSKLIDN